MTEPNFSMVHNTELCEEEIIDGFAIYAFLSYSDCEESARQQEGSDDTEEDESIGECSRTPKSAGSFRYVSNYRQRRRSRSDSRSSMGDSSNLNGSLFLESKNNNVYHRSVRRKKPGRPRGSIGRHKVQIKHQIFSDLCNPTVDTHQLSCLYDDYLQDRLREEEENKYKYAVPISMDESYVNSSLNALDSSYIKETPCIQIENIKKELTPDIDVAGDSENKQESPSKLSVIAESDADVMEMSGKQKREIRLPARYHQPGHLMGSQWVMTEHNSDDKLPKKRMRLEGVFDAKNSHSLEQNIRSFTLSSEPSAHLLQQDQPHRDYSQNQEQLPPQHQPLQQYQPLQQQQVLQQQPLQQQPLQQQPLQQQPLQQQPLQQQPLQQHPLQQQPLQQQPLQHHILQLQSLQQKPLLQQFIPVHQLLHQTIQQAQQQELLNQPLQYQSHLKPLYSCENQRIIPYSAITINLDRTKEEEKSLSSDLYHESRESVTNVKDVPKLSSTNKVCPSHFSQLRLHHEKLERIQLLRKQQEIGVKMRGNTFDAITENILKDHPYVNQNVYQNVSQAINIVSPTIQSVTNNIVLIPSSSLSSCSSISHFNQQSLSTTNDSFNEEQSSNNSSNPNMDTSDPQKNAKLQELRQLYRDLYFENKPERRLIYAKSRIKPRVNKKAEVEEGIRVIEKLTKREKQLEYIKTLLTMWNKKLTLAAKVISDKGVIPKAIDVVQDVLKTYQTSKSYRVTEAWDTMNKSKTSSLVNTINTDSSQNDIKPEPSSRSDVSVIKSTGSTVNRIVVNPPSHPQNFRNRVISMAILDI